VRTAVLILIVLGGIAQYTLAYLAMKDLVRRPRVRGDNKVAWALVVLCLPLIGAILYDWNGKTGFRSRAGATAASNARRRLRSAQDLTGDRQPRAAMPDLPDNVTPIRAARSYRERTDVVVPLRSGPRPLPIREAFAGTVGPGTPAGDPSAPSLTRPTGS